jgi:prephenate dehydrogenase
MMALTEPRRPRIGVVGCGSFGRLLLSSLAPFADLTCYDADIATLRDIEQPIALDWASVAAADIVVLAVPVQAIEGALRAIAPHLRRSTLVVDVCSVKLGPLAAMQRLLPADCEILGTHPLFGPQSARHGLRGSGIALVPVRGRKWRRVAAFLKCVLGLDVVVTTAERHDRDMAYVQGLTHMLARVAANMHLPATRLTTRTYGHMLSMVDLVGQDSDALFEAIMAENPYSAAVYDEFVGQFTKLRDMVSEFDIAPLKQKAEQE